MYHRGGDRGWHRGHHQRDIFPPRNHQSTPYRGGYQDHREQNSYGQYDHNACHDRNYDDSQYMEYQEPTYHDYHEENRPYQDHRDSRDQTYHVRGRHDGGYQKEFRGGYKQSHGESSRYHNLSKSQRKKYTYTCFKPPIKEGEARVKTSTQKPVQSAAHNPVRNVVTSLDGSPQDKDLSQETSKPASEDAKDIQESTTLKDKMPTQDEANLVQNGAKATKDGGKPAQVSGEPSKEDIKLCSENKPPSEFEGTKPLDKGINRAKEDVKIEHVDTNKRMNKHTGGEPVCDTKLSTTEMTTQISCKTECMENAKETLTLIKEERQDFSIIGNETQEETFLAKRMCSQDGDQFFSSKTVEIPLLGGWGDTPIETAGTSTKRHPDPVVDYGLSPAAHDLRKAFILAKKEEIELAFSQDCRTFAFVASTLLRKDPSLEVAVSNALRSTLQDIAGRCVQELSKFIDHYDNIPVNISERLQNSEI